MNMVKPMKTIVSTAAVCIVIAFSSVASVNAADNDMLIDAPREAKGHKHEGHKAHRGQKGDKGHRGQKGQDQKQKMKRMAKALSLTEEQKIEIKAIKTQAKEQHQTLRESMKEFKIAEKKLLQSETFDEQEFSALHDTYQPIFRELALTRAQTKHAFFNVLTAEQQEKMHTMMQHRKTRGKSRGK